VADIDVGLRQYMLKVYNFMTGGLVVTGLVAYGVAGSPTILRAIYGTPLQWVVMLAPWLCHAFRFPLQKMRASTAQIALLGLRRRNGALPQLYLPRLYRSLGRAGVFITAGTFAGMSLYGYTTKRDLAGSAAS